MISNNYPYYQNPNMPQFTPQMLQAGQQAQAQMQAQMQPQIQSPFVMVRSEAEARNYPVGYGNSVTFKDEVAPYVYSKTMGFSQLDKPIFEKYRLIKEESEEEVKTKDCQCENLKDKINGFGSRFDDVSDRIADLTAQISSLWDEIDILKEKDKKKRSKEDKE